MRFMQIELVLQTKNWSEPAKNQFSVALVRRLLTVDCKWQVFIKQYLQVEQLTGCNTKYLEKVILQLPNHFWKDVLQSLININKKVTFTEEDILKALYIIIIT